MGRTSSDLYLDSLDEATSDVIKTALQALDEMDHLKAFLLLKPLVDEGNAAALYYAASFGFSDEGNEFERRHIRQLEASAAKGFAPAIHALAICYDAGDMVDRDTKKAALFFKRAAEAKHPHAQWIHGNDLLFGRNGIERNEELGLKFIHESAEAKFEGALVSMAEMYESGSYGLPRDVAKALELREKLNDPDVIGY